MTARTVADVLREYYELDLPASSIGMQPLDEEALDVLQRVEGYTAPVHFAGQLTAALRALWVARTSRELRDDDADATLWALSELSSLLEHAIEAHDAAVHWRIEHEKCIGRTKPPVERRQAQGGPK